MDIRSALAQIATALGEGADASSLTCMQVVARAAIIFFASLVIVRIADKRFFAKKTAFDVILGFILASMLARAINGSERLVPTIAAGVVLALLHQLLGWLACRSRTLGGWIKGHSQTLIEDGEVDRTRLRKHHIADDDLVEDLRLKGVERPEEVKLARLERSGEVSVIKRAGKAAG